MSDVALPNRRFRVRVESRPPLKMHDHADVRKFAGQFPCCTNVRLSSTCIGGWHDRPSDRLTGPTCPESPGQSRPTNSVSVVRRPVPTEAEGSRERPSSRTTTPGRGCTCRARSTTPPGIVPVETRRMLFERTLVEHPSLSPPGCRLRLDGC
jgi:hypothetical protein